MEIRLKASNLEMFVTTKRRVVEEEVTEFINVKEREKQMREKMKFLENRLHSFPRLSLLLEPNFDKLRLAIAGFYNHDNLWTKCFSCGLWKTWSFWREGHDPETVHRTESPNCDFLKGDNVPINWYNYSLTRKTISAPRKRQDSIPTPGNVMTRKRNPQRKESNTKLKSQTKNNTYSENQSPKETKEENTERKNNTFSPSSVQTGESDKIPTTRKPQRPSSDPAESTIERQTPNRRAKVSIGKTREIQTSAWFKF